MNGCGCSKEMMTIVSLCRGPSQSELTNTTYCKGVFMKKAFYIFAFLFCCTSNSAFADDRLKVVATLTSFADIAAAVGGDYVEVASIASPRFNPHFIEPKPSDVLRLKRADLYIHSGLDLEAWGAPLVDAAARPDLRKGGARQLDLSEGINLLEIPAGQVSRAEGDIHLFGNPHYWLDPNNGVVIAKTIAAKLIELDPSHRQGYETNRERFIEQVLTKINEWSSLVAPFKGQKLVGYHNEWVYLMHFTGLTMEQFLEPKPGIPPTPGQISAIIEYVKHEHVKGIVQPTFYPTDAADEVAARTGAKVVTACQNVHETSAADNYVSMIDYNIHAIVEALKS